MVCPLRLHGRSVIVRNAVGSCLLSGRLAKISFRHGIAPVAEKTVRASPRQ